MMFSSLLRRPSCQQVLMRPAACAPLTLQQPLSLLSSSSLPTRSYMM